MTSFNPLVHNPEQSRGLLEYLSSRPVSTARLEHLQRLAVDLSAQVSPVEPVSYEGVSALGMYDWGVIVTHKDVSVRVKNFADSTGKYYSREHLLLDETDQSPHPQYVQETSRWVIGPCDIDLGQSAHRRMVRIANRVLAKLV